MSYLGPYRERANSAHELRAIAWRLIVMFSIALAVALAARLTFGPSLF